MATAASLKKEKYSKIALVIIFLIYFSWRLFCWHLEADFFRHNLSQTFFACALIVFLLLYLKLKEFNCEEIFTFLILQSFPYLAIFHDSMSVLLISIAFVSIVRPRELICYALSAENKTVFFFVASWFFGIIFAMNSFYVYGVSRPALSRMGNAAVKEALFIIAFLVVGRMEHKKAWMILRNRVKYVYVLYGYCAISILYLITQSSYYHRFGALGAWSFYRLVGTFYTSSSLAMFISFFSTITFLEVKDRKIHIFMLVKVIEVAVLCLASTRSGFIVYFLVSMGLLFIKDFKRYRFRLAATMVLAVFAGLNLAGLAMKSWEIPRNLKSSAYYSHLLLGEDRSVVHKKIFNEGHRLLDAGQTRGIVHRADLLRSTMAMISDNYFLLGVGIGLESIFSKARGHSHNTIVTAWGEKGFLGLISSFIIVFIIPFSVFYRYLKTKNTHSAVVFLGCGFPLFFFSLTHGIDKHELLWILLALCYSHLRDDYRL